MSKTQILSFNKYCKPPPWTKAFQLVAKLYQLKGFFEYSFSSMLKENEARSMNI